MPMVPRGWMLAPRLAACLGGCRFCEGRRDAAKSSLRREDGLLGGLLQTIATQTFGGG